MSLEFKHACLSFFFAIVGLYAWCPSDDESRRTHDEWCIAAISGMMGPMLVLMSTKDLRKCCYYPLMFASIFAWVFAAAYLLDWNSGLITFPIPTVTASVVGFISGTLIGRLL